VALAHDPAYHVPGLAAAAAPRAVVTVPRAVAVVLPEAVVARAARPLDLGTHVLAEHPVDPAAFAVEQLAAAAHPGASAVHAHAEHPDAHVVSPAARAVLPLLPARAE
jgi:hypothetical protein